MEAIVTCKTFLLLLLLATGMQNQSKKKTFLSRKLDLEFATANCALPQRGEGFRYHRARLYVL